MTLTEARQLQRFIKGYGIHCTVPLGNGPSRYFCRIVTSYGPLDFKAEAEARKYIAGSLRRRRKAWREYDQMMWRKALGPRRSPIEMMIDRACGLE